MPVSFVTITTIAFVIAAVLAALFNILYYNERQRRIDAEFIADEARHTLKQLVMRCSVCHGNGKLALPGGWMSCNTCREARTFLIRFNYQ